MKFITLEKQKIRLIEAAFLLGIFALNPLGAHAMWVDGDKDMPLAVVQEHAPATRSPAMINTRVEPAPSNELSVQPTMADLDKVEGLLLSDLKELSPDLQVEMQGREIRFSGHIPASCARDAEIRYRYNAGDKKHTIAVLMPNCGKRENFRNERAVPLKDVKGWRLNIDNVDGEIVLAQVNRARAGSSRYSPKMEALKGYLEEGREEVALKYDAHERLAKQQQLEEEENKKRADNEAAARKAQREESERQRLARFNRRLDEACKANGHIGVTAVVEEYADLFHDVSTTLERIRGSEKESLVRAVKNAKTTEAAKEAFQAYSEAAERYEFSSEEIAKVQEEYVQTRFRLIRDKKDDADDGKVNFSETDREISDFASDLRDLDSRLYRKHKGKVAELYGDLAAAAANGSKKSNKDLARNMELAEKYYNKAKRYLSSQSEKDNVNGAIAKLNGEAFKQCLKNDPSKMADCEKRHVNKAKEYADLYKDGLENRSGDEEVAAELANFQRQYHSAFGAGPSMYMNGFGSWHPYMPGQFEQMKVQSYQQMIQQQYQKMMFGGGMMGGGATQQKGFFGF